MANGPNITSASGLRRIQIFALDSSGIPTGDEADINAYDGINVEGAKSLSLNIPNVQRIQHIGNDRLLAQDYLPPTEGASGEITTAKQNLALDATLTGTSTVQVGETTVGGLVTNKQGSEIDVCVVAYRQALNTTEGASQLRRWQVHMFPVARLIPRAGSADQGGADENRYDVVPSIATAYPWGHAFSNTDEGFTEAQYLRFTAENPPVMDKWTGINTVTTYALNWTPISTAKMAVFDEGTLVTVSSVSVAGKTVTLDSGPTNGGDLVAWYETTDDI